MGWVGGSFSFFGKGLFDFRFLFILVVGVGGWLCKLWLGIICEGFIFVVKYVLLLGWFGLVGEGVFFFCKCFIGFLELVYIV